ncbi:hypothetical protein LEP1GSC043_1332 [Leptospira weilii str. Ecochallenge]|uniref:Uncharacterized protein n=1 Tax=Leptospira weilii str. Ecochallenge TaxID=1049986 RepID=N1U789_9LEPT|nr:hypothetical protein LEP1GSC043_1332 [Leptospira weilii str. Ecochallenge]
MEQNFNPKTVREKLLRLIDKTIQKNTQVRKILLVFLQTEKTIHRESLRFSFLFAQTFLRPSR